jgi:hypothetical protein
MADDGLIEKGEKESIWKRLTRLFRSGPIVRHKIAAGERYTEPRGTARAYKKELSSLYVHSLASYGQYERLSRYADYSEMEFTPEIASALDIYADETTSYNENGAILDVISKDNEIKQVLETLFFDILNIEFNIWSWVRNLCKYGDFLLFVDASEENGILNLLPVPINEIEREEGYDKDDPFAVRFRWLTQGNMILENWQVIHFRLLGNDNFLPYGASVIEPARRIWRQLILIEDAMLVYRIVRSPERRVFKIDVGNVPPDQVESYMEQVKTRLRRNQVIDPNTGRVDLRYNPLSVDEDYFIPVRGDRSSDISTLAGGQFTGDIDDVQYIQNKLFAALKIPKAYLGYEQDIGSKATLAQQDVRFARTVERIQKLVVAELQKIAIEHLFLLGYNGADLVNFTLKLSSSSSIAEQQKLELWRARFEIAATAQEGILDRETIYRKIFNLSDEDIERIKMGKRMDKLEDLTLEQMQLPAEEQPGGAAAPAGGEAPPPDEVPGEEELPTTLGGAAPEPGGAPEAGGEAAPTGEAVLHEEEDPVLQALPPEPSIEELVDEHFGEEFDEKRNPGSEGDQAEVSATKGHDLFDPSTDLSKHVFGTEKQTASDPYDLRARNRLITRPVGVNAWEGVDMRPRDRRSSGEIFNEQRVLNALTRTEKIEKDVNRVLREAKVLLRKGRS